MSLLFTVALVLESHLDLKVFLELVVEMELNREELVEVDDLELRDTPDLDHLVFEQDCLALQTAVLEVLELLLLVDE